MGAGVNNLSVGIRNGALSTVRSIFFVDEWEGGSKYHYNMYTWVIISPPAKHHLNGVSLACR